MTAQHFNLILLFLQNTHNALVDWKLNSCGYKCWPDKTSKNILLLLNVLFLLETV